jgi:hypothetical protein
MSPQEWLATVRRRWYVLALSLIVAIVGLYAVHQRSISYSGCNSVILSGPLQPWAPNTEVNPAPSLAVTTGIVTATMNSEQTEQQLRAAGVTSYYTVAQVNTGSSEVPTYTAPMLQVCATADQPWTVVDTVSAVTTKFQAVLHQIQAKAHVPAKSMITASTLVPAIPAAGTGRPSQAYLGVLLLALLGALALIFWLDPVIDRLHRRRRLAALEARNLPLPAPRQSA